ncbi:uncharacterized protein LOC129189333 isoform X1 [Dunckerocampus dactyliophorus]|uniref:uncharacterized protein LOC129189333 isoform X1 n=1 Tax=Dunckerocampus dactyliophorus TaxID=161453 RepID=UPI002405941E|nr:uncharacterized protein LOC129189333 isoform X1 [Dunckerocampus dactyliophorus]XP_054646914.1 uncharacterized protein LOC129189333 isoform X1 [Dunckerocampus dactyliophorus]XP_054646915.1 uncharacterized protein LOC129189333 isoform X1 [Dunckerocampus dactyliophorus]
MVEEIVTKRLGLVLMITTHMVISGPGQAEVTGIVSHNVTLQFTFNDAITAKSHFAVYTTGPQKMAECSPRKGCSTGKRGFDLYFDNSSVLCQITNLTQGHTGTYWATLFTEGGQTRPSPSVHLIVQEENSHDTNSHEQENSTTTKYQPRESSPLFFGPIFAVLVVSLVVLLAATLPCFFWRCVRARDCSAEENSQPATQVPPAVPEPTFVYSVMDFPMRQATHLKEKPIGTYYCSIRYHPNQKK